MLEKNYLQDQTKKIVGMVTELSYRVDIGLESEFGVGEGILLALSDKQLEREARTKVNIWRSELMSKLKRIEEKSKSEVMTVARAATSESKYRFLETVTDNWRNKAWKSKNFADFFLKSPSRNQNAMFPAVPVLMRLLDTVEDSRSLQLLHAELYRYCRIRGSNMGELEVSIRDIELAFTRSLCNQLRHLERGITKPNLRELVLLRKFLTDCGDE